MLSTVLDVRAESGDVKCFLCKISLEEYVAGLSSTYQDYDLQREIVTNIYLNRLVFTVLDSGHIPPIVLVAAPENVAINGSTLAITEFRILDGLQRTYRLRAIRQTMAFCSSLSEGEDYLGWSKFKLSRQFSSALNKIDSNTDVLSAILPVLAAKGHKGLLQGFRDNYQWFEVWVGLDPDAEVQKMLMLNAGHKPVKTRHQLELLFLNLLPFLLKNASKDFKIVREKEVSATEFGKTRATGQFHFAHVITSLISLSVGRAVGPSIGLIQSIQVNDLGIEEYREVITPAFLKTFVRFLIDLDKLILAQYPSVANQWIGRDVALAGLFGAVGAAANDEKKDLDVILARLLALLAASPQLLNLDSFEESRNQLDLAKVNIGNANRSAVFGAISELLKSSKPKPVAWDKHFPGVA